MSELDAWLDSVQIPEFPAGVRVPLVRGLTGRMNSMNPFLVMTLRYEADPSKDPLTPEGKVWLHSEMRDMGCRRICRPCDHIWAVEDEVCPECGADAELVLSNRWRREYEIDYSAHSGSYVFDSFSKARNVCKPFRIPASWRRYRLIDHGVRNPTACLLLAVDPDGAAWVYAEHYEAGMPVPHHARQIHRMCVEKDHHALEMGTSILREMELTNWTPTRDFTTRCSKLYKTIGDPSMNNRTQADVQTVKQRYLEYGIYIQPANNATPGLETLNYLFSEGTLTIFDTCENTIREVENLVWEERSDSSKNKKEREVDRDNHCTDTLKYWANDFSPPARERPVKQGEAKTGDERAERDRESFTGQHKPAHKQFYFDRM
jgi:hypothetical protein